MFEGTGHVKLSEVVAGLQPMMYRESSKDLLGKQRLSLIDRDDRSSVDGTFEIWSGCSHDSSSDASAITAIR